MDPLSYQPYPLADNYGRLCSSSVLVSYSHASDDANDHSGGGSSIRSNDEHIQNYRVQTGYHSIGGVRPFEDTPYLPQRAHPASAHHVPIPPEPQPEYIQPIANSFGTHFSNPTASSGPRNDSSGAPEQGLYPPGNNPSQLIGSDNSYTAHAAGVSHINSPTGSQSGQSPTETARQARLRNVGEHLRRKLNLPPGTPVNLAAIPDLGPDTKPFPPLAMLTQLAIYGSRRQRLTLQEIYAAIEDRFSYFRQDTKWKGSIRHNLSLNKIFRSTPRPITEPGKGTYWEVDVEDGEGYKRARKRKPKEPAGETPAAADADGKSDEDDEVSVPSSPGSPLAPSLNTEGPMRSSSIGPRRSRISPARTSPYLQSNQQQAYTRGPGVALPTHYSGMQPQFGKSGFARAASRSYRGSQSLQPGPSSLTTGARSVPHPHFPSSSRAPPPSRSLPLLDPHTYFGYNQEHQQIGHFPSASYIPPSEYSRQPSPYHRQGPQIMFSPENHGDVANTGSQFYQSHGYIGGELGGASGRGPRYS